MSAQLLDRERIEQWLDEHPDWTRSGDKLTKTFEFEDFSEAFAFMVRVALIAETKNHHPEWSNVYNTVDIALTTHDVGGLSDLDLDFAAAVDELVASA